jgi:hypothetical protein
MAIAAGLIVALFLFLGSHLLGARLRNPRWLLVALCGIAALYMYGARQLEKDIQDVHLVAARSADCPANRVQVVIANGRTADIIGFAFTLHGFRPNFSDHVAYDSHRTDRIVPAGHSWSSCWVVDDLVELPTAQKSMLRWDVEFTSIDFAE